MINRKKIKKSIYKNKKNNINETEWKLFIHSIMVEIKPYYDKIKFGLRYNENKGAEVLAPMISARQLATIRACLVNLRKGNIQESIHEYFDFILNYNMGNAEFSDLEICIMYELGELICERNTN